MNKKNELFFGLLILGGAGLLIWKGGQKVKEVAESVTDTILPGAKSEGIDDKIKQLQNSPKNNPFSPQYMLSRKGKAGLKYVPSATKQIWADKVYKEYTPDFGEQYVFAPSPDVILNILKSIQQKNQLSDFAYFYNAVKKRDLLADIQKGLKAAGWTNLTYSTAMLPILDYANKKLI